jgi:hypothetical protein
VDVSSVADIWKVHAASTFGVDREEGGSFYLENIGNAATLTEFKTSKTNQHQ